MTTNRIEQFFDSLAPRWDEDQGCTSEVKRALLKKVGIGEGARVLDVACGTGAITAELHELTGGEVLGIDLSGEMIAVAKRKFADCDWAAFEKADFFEVDGESLLSNDTKQGKGETKYQQGEAFDIIVVYNAYPHFMDVAAFRDKAHSLLKDGGKLAIVHSIGRSALNSHHKQHADHVSRMISSPQDEAKAFASLFDVEIAEESDEHYLLVLSKTA